MNKNDFIQKANLIHSDKYDYSEVDYINGTTKVKIICPTHGEFSQTPNNHIHKTHPRGCPMCNGGVKQTKGEFISKAQAIHGDKYDYSKVEYINNSTKVCIICPEHGEFWQIPSNHTHKTHPRGCSKCNGGVSFDIEEWKQHCSDIHNNFYDYSKVDFSQRDSKGRVCIICPDHGEFWQHPSQHYKGVSCAKCKGVNILTTKDFISKAIEVHGDKYDYSKVEYVNTSTKVCIICPEHGEFWQTANSHLSRHGCPHCATISRLENEVENMLKTQKIKYILHYKPIWLGRQSVDFYLPDYNIAIECQGIQHFKPIEHFGGEKYMNNIVALDERKRQLCANNNLTLLYFTHAKCDYPYDVITNIDNLLKTIIKND